jgi:hypothetical protein
MHYRIVTPPDPYAAEILEGTLALLLNDKGMQRDRKRLVNVCCKPDLPVPLQGAPRPASLSAREGLSI